MIDQLPEAEDIIEILKSMEAPYYPEQINVSENVFTRGIYYAKDLRDRFGLLQILFDLNLQEEFTNRLIRLYNLKKRWRKTNDLIMSGHL